MNPRVYATPLRTRFRGLDVRDGVLVAGPAGWGEFSPFWDYDIAESAAWWRAAHEAATLGWPAPRRTRIPVNVTVPAVGPDRAAEIVAASGGCTTAKVKVAEPGQSVADEQARLEAVRSALGPGGRIRIDANGAWDLDTALGRLAVLDRAAGGLEYAEQPCADVADLAALRRRGSVPIAADESIRRAEDPMAVVRAEAADVVVLKVQPLGGVRAALRIAEEVGLPVVVSSALETSVGIAAGLALAAALPTLEHACGLATVHLLTADVVADPLVPVDGTIAVRRPEPDPAALEATAADDVRTARWRARLDAVAELTGLAVPVGADASAGTRGGAVSR
ncbi:O-succinylbenzoate synthase [Occultella glacieicola]|uniref:o-succinylbenzoate synthase n=1 Tax=Occultella glacieicola TaxID=2518684 RepID=A0ABY2E657_9MICO|nr:o-succinylbenzoate synthase [Occultella glacieicola]TDE91708.1 O-succinylbenzoate synthase [Occultella glacieicola]